MTATDPVIGSFPGMAIGKKIVKHVDETVGIHENTVWKKLFEKDPILKDLVERDAKLGKRIMEREVLRVAKLKALRRRLNKTNSEPYAPTYPNSAEPDNMNEFRESVIENLRSEEGAPIRPPPALK